MIQYKNICEQEIDRELFRNFIRRQVVVKCMRKEDGCWKAKDAPFKHSYIRGYEKNGNGQDTFSCGKVMGSIKLREEAVYFFAFSSGKPGVLPKYGLRRGRRV